MEKGILLRVAGGFGKNLMATKVAKQLKDKHPKLPLHVQVSNPDAFIGLNFVDKFYPLAPLMDFYDDHKDFKIYDADPYTNLDYRSGKEHLVNSWCKTYGTKPPESVAGIIRLSKKEKKAAAMIMQNVRNQAQGRKVVGFQYVGGTSFYDPNAALDPIRPTQVRELPVEIAQNIVNGLASAGCMVIQIGLATEQKLENSIQLIGNDGKSFPIRIVLAIIDQLDGLVGIDSFAHHAWAALGKKNAVVVWGATRRETLGYETNINIAPAANCCPTPGCNRPNGHVGDFVGTGQPWQCPHDAACMDYNAEEIVKKTMAALESEEKKAKKEEKK
jgi:hypothetical protein